MSRRLLGLAAVGVLASVARADGTIRLSVDRSRNDSNGASSAPAITPDARFVAFASDATDLVRGDTNGVTDVFVRDRQHGSTDRVSVDSLEREGHGASFDPSISADGRFVAFTSVAEDLVVGDTNHWSDVFVRDRLRGITIRVSVSSLGGQGSEGSFSPAISGDGSTIAFVSQAADLVTGDGNFSWDVFVHALATGATERVSLDPSGAEADSGSLDPAISDDGRLVVFTSLASNLAPDDQNACFDIYLRDRTAAVTLRISNGLGGQEPDDVSLHPTISGDGQFVAFESRATNLVPSDGNGCSDVFLLDRTAGITGRVSVDSSGAEAHGNCFAPSLGSSGRWIVFTSSATDLVPGDGNGVDDVFAHDRLTAITSRVSLTATGGEGNDGSGEPSVSSNGDNVAFTSSATNLVAKDRNRASDVFSRERCVNEASTAYYGAGWPGTLGEPRIVPGSDPELNQVFHFTITNSWGPYTAALLVIGAGKISLPTNRDGTLLAAPLILQILCIPPTGLTVDCAIPPNESACGAELDVQVLEWDPGATKSVSFSQGLEVIFGY